MQARTAVITLPENENARSRDLRHVVVDGWPEEVIPCVHETNTMLSNTNDVMLKKVYDSAPEACRETLARGESTRLSPLHAVTMRLNRA
eukprot:2621344-Pleurochrysis_carterae.AAC.1